MMATFRNPIRRCAKSHAEQGYGQLLTLIAAFEAAGVAAGEVITAGTPAMPCSLAFDPFQSGAFVHRVSPGTLVYNDLTSLDQLSAIPGLRPAALVVATRGQPSEARTVHL